MANISEVVEKIRKLLALSKSTNENEAANAAAAARALMRKYELDEAALEIASGETRAVATEDVVISKSGRRIGWKASIVHGLANLNRCHMYTQGGEIHVFGRQAQIQTITYTFMYLCREVESLTDDAWARADEAPRKERIWKNAFRLGCASRLYWRMTDAAETEAEHRKLDMVSASPKIDTMALQVVVRNDEKVNEDWEVFAKATKMGKARGGSYSHSDAYNQGVAAGGSVSLGGSKAALGANPSQINGQ